MSMLGVHCSTIRGSFQITIVTFSWTLTVYLDWFLPASAGRLRKLLNLIRPNCELNDADYVSILHFMVAALSVLKIDDMTKEHFKKLDRNEKLLKGEIEKWQS